MTFKHFVKKQLPAILLFFFATTAAGCHFHLHKSDQLDITPLSPYNDSITFANDEDVSKERKGGIKIQYYLIDDDVEYTNKYEALMEDYIENSFKSDIKANKAIYFTIYKSSSALNTDSKPSKEELTKDHLPDKFAEFEYLNGKLYNFDYYKDGDYYTPKGDE